MADPRFILRKTASRGGISKGRAHSWVWHLKGRHAPEIEDANPGWSRPFGSKRAAERAAKAAVKNLVN